MINHATFCVQDNDVCHPQEKFQDRRNFGKACKIYLRGRKRKKPKRDWGRTADLRTAQQNNGAGRRGRGRAMFEDKMKKQYRKQPSYT